AASGDRSALRRGERRRSRHQRCVRSRRLHESGRRAKSDASGTAYIARAMVHQVIAIGDATRPNDPGPFSLAASLPVRRIEIRDGKWGMADWFDVNAVGSDSHLQFMNWTTDNNGAYDYAADTRGYTLGVEAEYQDAGWGVRFAEALMPTVANGIDYDWHLDSAHSENIELERRHGLLPGQSGIIRVLAYANHANM